MKLNIYKSVDELLKKTADYFMQTVNTAMSITGECNLVLSGGSSPKRLYELLASYPYKAEIDWDSIYFFFGDERCVPFNDPANNGLMVKKALFEPLKIADSRIFYISTLLKPEEAALKYSKRIIAHFKDKPIRFDLILLGLGDNAHTASLFPHTPVLNEQKALVSAVYLEKEQSSRITMTAPLINEAQAIAFLVYGENKSQAVKQVLEGERNPEIYPAQLIHPEDGTLDWFLDEDAARLLLLSSKF
jgi:6-phosphogluconolactonase